MERVLWLAIVLSPISIVVVALVYFAWKYRKRQHKPGSFVGAVAMLNRGLCVRRVAWSEGCHLFEMDGTLHVKTLDNLVTQWTPTIMCLQATDWVVYNEGEPTDFAGAVAMLKEGRKVRRLAWPREFYLRAPTGMYLSAWKPKLDDFTATDWVAYTLDDETSS